ncbi:MAG: 4-alpha-glucanotransferase [Clostridiales bacterium]|nr:4-alpha-glucanotransferase [Clostridiales bacterium]
MTAYTAPFSVEPIEKPKHVRLSGILAHPTSFPSPYGIGDLGPGAYDFVDFLEKSGQHLWQVLPLGPTGYGDSPYQGPSAFAGQPLLISPDLLIRQNLLTKEDVAGMPAWDENKIDYGSAITFKNALLKKAWFSFLHTPDKTMIENFEAFCEEQKSWLDDFTLFMACKDAQKGISWLEWEPEFRDPSEKQKKALRAAFAEQIRYYAFLQFLFQEQWDALRTYANEKGIQIIGDIPIFVSPDSADVWSNKKLFQLDAKGYPSKVAGVPPDYFSATGQLWGNPLYDWDYHEETGYKWWINRVRRQLSLTDFLRIDHFRGFEAYWAVPAGEETAINGQWVKGPCEKLFRAIEKELGEDLPIWAEDLGVITPEVEHLRDSLGFPGMKVLQFGFGDMNDTTYIPFYYTTTNCICYTGTHDNDTTVGWYQSQPDIIQDRIRRLANADGNNVGHDFICFAMGSIAKYAIFPFQDVLQLGSEARMNTPGIAMANWAFRFKKSDLHDGLAKWLLEVTKLYGRHQN